MGYVRENYNNVREMSGNFKVTQDQKSPILTQMEYFRTVTPVFTDGFEMMHKACSI